MRLRLQGIDAPEICQPGGAGARATLQALMRGEPLLITVYTRDRYGRASATVQRQRDGQDVVAQMVQGGWAWSDTRGWRRGRHEPEEEEARYAERGIFAHGEPEHPADFRRRHEPCSRR